MHIDKYLLHTIRVNHPVNADLWVIGNEHYTISNYSTLVGVNIKKFELHLYDSGYPNLNLFNTVFPVYKRTETSFGQIPSGALYLMEVIRCKSGLDSRDPSLVEQYIRTNFKFQVKGSLIGSMRIINIGRINIKSQYEMHIDAWNLRYLFTEKFLNHNRALRYSKFLFIKKHRFKQFYGHAWKYFSLLWIPLANEKLECHLGEEYSICGCFVPCFLKNKNSIYFELNRSMYQKNQIIFPAYNIKDMSEL